MVAPVGMGALISELFALFLSVKHRLCMATHRPSHTHLRTSLYNKSCHLLSHSHLIHMTALFAPIPPSLLHFFSQTPHYPCCNDISQIFTLMHPSFLPLPLSPRPTLPTPPTFSQPHHLSPSSTPTPTPSHLHTSALTPALR